MTDQPRTPAGQPTGGQFSSHIRSDGEISLSADDAQHNAQGTFLYPAPVRSAAQLIAFFSDVEIPDEVLTSLSIGYERWADQWHTSRQAEWLRSVYYPAQGIDPGRAAAGQLSPAVQATVDAAAAEYSRVELVQRHPWTITGTSAREVARAGQMFHYSGKLDEEGRRVVDDHIVIVEGAPMTVAQVVDRYNLSGLRGWFAPPERAMIEGLSELIRGNVAIADTIGDIADAFQNR